MKDLQHQITDERNKKNRKKKYAAGNQMTDSDDDQIQMANAEQFGSFDRLMGRSGNQNVSDFNTIMQQINNFSLTPMNDTIAE